MRKAIVQLLREPFSQNFLNLRLRSRFMHHVTRRRTPRNYRDDRTAVTAAKLTRAFVLALHRLADGTIVTAAKILSAVCCEALGYLPIFETFARVNQRVNRRKHRNNSNLMDRFATSKTKIKHEVQHTFIPRIWELHDL